MLCAVLLVLRQWRSFLKAALQARVIRIYLLAALLGVLQYIAPTLQFLLGVLVYMEAFSHSQLIGYSLVWVALLIFGIEGYIAHRAPPGLVEQGG